MGILLTVMARDAATGEEFEAFHWTRDAESGVRRAYADAERHERPISHAWIGRTLVGHYVLKDRSGRIIGEPFQTYQGAFNHRASKGLVGAVVHEL